MRTIQTKLVSIKYADFTRKLLQQKGFQFSEKNIGETWWADEVIQFRFVCDSFENLEITIAQSNYEQDERNKPVIKN